MKYRKLRIAWSVGWGVVVVLLCVLWVRSHQKMESWTAGPIAGCEAYFEHLDGRMVMGVYKTHPNQIFAFNILQQERQEMFLANWKPGFRAWFGSPNPALPWNFSLRMHHYMAVAVVAIFAALPWLRFRFSLRTLLIAMTLVAFGLGLLVWTMR